MSLDKEAADFLARESGINPAFIEKDWHAVRVLQVISRHQSDGLRAVFSGGTSLSKGHALIKRFSEDLDFKIQFDGALGASQLKGLRRSFRASLLAALAELEGVSFDDSAITTTGLGFKLMLSYAREYDSPGGMRPNLQVDFSYSLPQRQPTHRPIASLIAQYKSSPPETSIPCLSPIEIAADKLCALSWRVIRRNREAKDDDPAMVRHLHDLSALYHLIEKDVEVMLSMSNAAFDLDQKMPGRRVDDTLLMAARRALSAITSDPLYRKEYEAFVDAFSYANDAETIHFDAAVESFGLVVELLERAAAGQ